MMQRRNVSKSESGGESSSFSGGPPARIGRPLSASAPSPPSRRSGVSPLVLLVVAAILTVATYMFPEAEQEAVQEAYAAEQKLEHNVMDWWSQQRKPPVADAEENDDAEIRRAANERMLKQESKWVDGEKKLKEKLKVLAERQRQGQDLGVPVATRYLGEDIPAWPGEDVETWNAQVKQKYEEMRREEENWKEMVAAIIQSENRG